MSAQLRWELGSPVFGLLLRRYAPHDTYEVRAWQHLCEWGLHFCCVMQISGCCSTFLSHCGICTRSMLVVRTDL